MLNSIPLCDLLTNSPFDEHTSLFEVLTIIKKAHNFLYKFVVVVDERFFIAFGYIGRSTILELQTGACSIFKRLPNIFLKLLCYFILSSVMYKSSSYYFHQYLRLLVFLILAILLC